MSNELLRTRIGNTVTVVLPVLTRGDAVSLVGRDITIMLVDPNERKAPVSFTIGGVSNNIATFVVEGTSQTATGTYRAEVYENYRGTAMAVYDCDIFVLVARTEYENDGNEGVSSETTTLDPINIAWVGRDGYTPYIQDGYWYINGTSTNVKAAGENGDTPYIENGYWYIGGVSTGIKVDYTNEEAQRSAAEQVRVVAEAARVQAEAARTLAENSRLTEESGRSAAEGVRILAERDRQSAEAMRQTNEEIRTDNETARVEAELGRAASETSRAQVEATRVANETARQTAEATRAANEQTRVAEETDRAAAETARIAAETARETAEDGRASAEATRVSNEQTRVSNESTRQSNESARQSAETARQSAETARQAAYVAAENARDAAFAAKEATRDAANQAALDCADTLAALGQEIGEEGATYDSAILTNNGFIDSSGNIASSSSDTYKYSDFINISTGQVVTVTGKTPSLAVYLFAAYETDGTLIEVWTPSATGTVETHTFTATQNCKFRISTHNSSGSSGYLVAVSIGVSGFGLKKEVQDINAEVQSIQDEMAIETTTPVTVEFGSGYVRYSDHIFASSNSFQAMIGFDCSGKKYLNATIYNPADDVPSVITFLSADISDVASGTNAEKSNAISQNWVSGLVRDGSAGYKSYSVEIPAGAVYCLISSRDNVATGITLTNGLVHTEDLVDYALKKNVNASFTEVKTTLAKYEGLLSAEPLKSAYFDDDSLSQDNGAVHLLLTQNSNSVYRGLPILGIRILCRVAGTVSIVKGENIRVNDTSMETTVLQTFNVVAGLNTLTLDTPVKIKGENDYIGLSANKDTILNIKRVYSTSNVNYAYFNSTLNKVIISTADLVVALICATVSLPEEGEITFETRLDNVKTEIANLEKISRLPFLEQPYFYHWSPNDFTNYIPSQSIEDNFLAKRLGFKFVELNHQATATSGKYIVTHGNNGKFGQEFSSDYTNVAINTMSYDDIVANVVYNSEKATYNHTVSTLDAFCKNCVQLGLGVLLRGTDAALINTVRKYLPDTMIVMVGNTTSPRDTYGFKGVLTTYMGGLTASTICNVLYLRTFANARGGAPYSLNLTQEQIQYMIDEGTLENVVTELRAEGIFIGSSYCSASILDLLTSVGGCGHASTSYQCNPFSVPNFGAWSPLDSDLSGWTIPEGVTQDEGRLANNTDSSLVVITPSTDTLPLAKGQVQARIKGSVTFAFGNSSAGYTGYNELTPINVCLAGFNKDMKLTITIGANSSVEFLNYQVSRC